MRSIYFTSLFIFNLALPTALAKTEAPGIVCEVLPDINGCQDKEPTCALCHTAPPSLSPYGSTVATELGADFVNSLPAALNATLDVDTDNDGMTNGEELVNGLNPNVADAPAEDPVAENGGVILWDPLMALKRVVSLYCGGRAGYAKVRALAEAEDKLGFVDEELTRCLNSSYWLTEGLPRLADEKIQPLSAVGYGGSVVIGDFRYDYRLFTYVLSGDRDARELLTAQYHIDENGQKVLGVISRSEPPQLGDRIVIAGGEPLVPERRFGMITTQWYLASFTMFSELPRNTAAQAYRAYLGLDLAKGEGIFPVEGEPRDVDARGVAEPECATCHSTLDPLSYAFANYNGIETASAFFFNSNGQYSPGKTEWESLGFFMNQPVADLKEWTDLAIASDEFKINLAKMFFRHAIGRDPQAYDQEEFTALWRSMAEDGYSANRLIHRLIKTNAFAGR